MTNYLNAQATNNATATLAAGISNSATTIVLATGYGALFPSVFPFFPKIEQYDSQGRVLYREIVSCTNRVGDTLTVTRGYGMCPASYSATTQTNTAYAFNAGDTLSLTLTAEQVKNISDVLATALQTSGGTMTGLLKQAQSSSIASATTTDLSTATGNEVHITGTTTVTSLGTLPAGTQMTLVFDGSLTLTYNATSLILPGGVSITTQAGDCADMVSEGSGKWRCTQYTASSGASIVENTGTKILAVLSTNQSITGTATTKIVFGTKVFDTNTEFASSRFTATVAGYYQISVQVNWAGSSGAANYASIYKNGIVYTTNVTLCPSTNPLSQNISLIMSLAANDYIEVYGRTGVTQNVIQTE